MKPYKIAFTYRGKTITYTPTAASETAAIAAASMGYADLLATIEKLRPLTILDLILDGSITIEVTEA